MEIIFLKVEQKYKDREYFREKRAGDIIQNILYLVREGGEEMRV